MESICISICWYWYGSPFFFIIQNLLVFAYVYMCGSAKSLKETGEGQRLAPIPPGPPWIQNYPLGHSFDHFDPSPSLPIHHHHHLSIYIHFRPFTSIFIHHHPPSSITIHFHPFSSIFIHFHPSSSITIYDHPFSYVLSTWTQFQPFSSITNPSYPSTSSFIHSHIFSAIRSE